MPFFSDKLSKTISVKNYYTPILFLIIHPRYNPNAQKIKNIQPDNEAAMIPESKFPTVQPNAIIDPKPINNPPIKEFLTS